MSDDGFHEIQLNGKQLVFLFMAATVVSVVIFLCGVMVGRGVRGQQTPVTEMAAVGAADATPAEASTPDAPPAPVPAPTDAPPEPVDDYYRDLTAEQPTDMKAAPAESRPKQPERASEPAQARASATPPPSADAQPPSAVTSGGYAVQLVALSDRAEAESIVKRLVGKGYPAYVVNPVAGKPRIYRVQVGRFPERKEADRIAARLRAEEQFSPWVTR
ncbi:MAG TPA: SPOR domain-containing protein [Vicinamibacterales bacterium]